MHELNNREFHIRVHRSIIADLQEVINELLKSYRNGKGISRNLKESSISIWEKVIKHKIAEEGYEGPYKLRFKERPDLKEKLITCLRDHEILEEIIGKIKHYYSNGNEEGFVLSNYTGLEILKIHVKNEESTLFD